MIEKIQCYIVKCDGKDCNYQIEYDGWCTLHFDTFSEAADMIEAEGFRYVYKGKLVDNLDDYEKDDPVLKHLIDWSELDWDSITLSDIEVLCANCDFDWSDSHVSERTEENDSEGVEG